jgi:DNA-binding response OmpR family regulator
MARILVVEDDEDTASFLGYVLEDEAHRVDTAATLAQARVLYKEGGYDAVLLDRGLPDGDGLDFCREVREDGRAKVVVLSALKEPEEVRAGLDAGAAAYMTKPFQFVSVLERVRALLPAAA